MGRIIKEIVLNVRLRREIKNKRKLFKKALKRIKEEDRRKEKAFIKSLKEGAKIIEKERKRKNGYKGSKSK